MGVEARRTCMAEWWRNSGRLSVLGWRTWPGTDSRPRPELGHRLGYEATTSCHLSCLSNKTLPPLPYLLVMYGAISSLFFSRPLICRASAV